MSGTIGEVHVLMKRVQARDESGRFLAELRAGGTAGVKAVAEMIAGRTTANIAGRLRTRTGTLIGSVDSEGAGLTAFTTVSAPYAPEQEEGAGPHDIPNSFGYGPDFGIGGRFGGLFHPGNPAVHFLRDAGEGAAAPGLAILRSYLPG